MNLNGRPGPLLMGPVSSLPTNFNGSGSVRLFSSSSGGGRRQSKKSRGQEEDLVNAELVRYLLRDDNDSNEEAKSAHELEVRMVIDPLVLKENPDVEVIKSGSVTTLMEAVRVANELDADLIGVNLEQSPPVVRAQDYEKLKYQRQRAAQETANKSKSKPMKEIKFRAKIADHDLERKAADVIKYLSKGHSCQITLMVNGYGLRQDPDAIKTTLTKVTTLVGEENGIIQGNMKVNGMGTHASVVMSPVTASSSSKSTKSQGNKSGTKKKKQNDADAKDGAQQQKAAA